MPLIGKKSFVRCRWFGFKTGVLFTTNGNPLIGSQADWASENYFEHCKFRNCETSVLNQNLQALNNTFVATDIENIRYRGAIYNDLV